MARGILEDLQFSGRQPRPAAGVGERVLAGCSSARAQLAVVVVNAGRSTPAMDAGRWAHDDQPHALGHAAPVGDTLTGVIGCALGVHSVRQRAVWVA
jgi:NAD(P)H-hydrate repair Nnr-like enzyme with NAD(P)H-hydrate dehydratase domain